jgi:tetratricopeptide (TPR) repeat protein
MSRSLSSVVLISCVAPHAWHPEAMRHNNLCVQTLDEIECRHSLEFEPEFPDAWVNLGLIAQAQGDFASAREHYIHALRLNNEQASAYNDLGVLDFNEGNSARAEERFRRALKVNPDYTEARHNLGLAHWRLGRLDAAEADFRHMIASNAQLSQPYGNLGALALERGRWKEALTWLEKAVMMEPGWADAWDGVGKARQQLGDEREAQDAFEMAADIRAGH